MTEQTYRTFQIGSKPALTLAGNYRRLMPPVLVIGYIDRLVVYFDRPLTKAELHRLAECQMRGTIDGPLSRGDLFSARIIYRHRRRKLTMWSVSPQTLEWLDAHYPDARVAYVEIAADGCYADPVLRDLAVAYLRRHLVRPYQRREPCHVGRDEWGDMVMLDHPAPDASTYFGKRLVLYDDPFPRMAADRPYSVAHLEQRFRNHRECEAAGLATVRAIAHLDDHEFWRGRIRLVRFDPALIGRTFANLNSGRRRQHTTEADRLDGLARLARYVSAQELLIDYREFHIDPAVVELPLDGWLPRPRAS